MQKLLTIFGLTVAAVIAIAAYPYVQMTDGKILLVDSKIQFAAASAYALTNAACMYNVYGFAPTGRFDIAYVTVSSWMYLPSAPGLYAGLFGRTRASLWVNSAWPFYINNGGYATMIISDNSHNEQMDFDLFPITNWIHVVSTFDGTNLVVYTNSTIAATQASVNVTAMDTTPGGVFSWGVDTLIYHNQCNANFDEVGVWSRALSSNEVAVLYGSGNPPAYNASKSPFNSGLQAYWKCDITNDTEVLTDELGFSDITFNGNLTPTSRVVP